MSELPPNWKWQTLPEIVTKDKRSIKRGPFGGSLKKEIFVSSGYKVYEQKNAINDDFDIGTYFITKEKFEEMKAFSIKPKDIIISCSGTIGKIAIVPKESKDGIINQALLKITLDKNKVRLLFFKYLFESNIIQKKLTKISRGVAIKNVPSVKNLKEIKFPIPNTDEQDLIIQEIETQFTRIDAVLKSLNSIKKRLDVYRKSILRAAFEGSLIKVKDKWLEHEIKEVVKVRYGKGLPKQTRNSQGSIPVYGSAGVVDKHDQQLIDFPTIIVARKGSIGNNFITKVPCWPIDTVYYLDDIKINLDYLYHFLNFSTFKDTSTAIPSLRREDLEAMTIKYPNKEQYQIEIVNEIESRFSVIDKIKQTIDASLKKAEQLRKSILRSAFEGKLVKYKGDNK